MILLRLYSDKNIYIGKISYAENRFVFKFELFWFILFPLTLGLGFGACSGAPGVGVNSAFKRGAFLKSA